MTRNALADRLFGLADRLRNLTVQRRDPEEFFEQRSELENALREIAREFEEQEPAPPENRMPIAERRVPTSSTTIVAGGKRGGKGQFVRVEVRRRRTAA